MATSLGMKDSRATWSHARDLFLVTQLQAQADSGKRADNGFKKEAWRAVCNAFNLEYGVNYLPAQLKSRVDCEYQQAPVTKGRGGRKVSALDDDISSDSDDSDNMMPRKKKPRQQKEQRSAGSIIGEAMSKLVEVENAKLDQVKKVVPIHTSV
ncbi:hypothetical protein H257_08906 [Aphanomyces astaci]|uniref:Myb/SANT-like domain-containing protein n=1 Tax=Aphanomyces astaci TaxID=112090 RepID=W4GE02_APHAT|nr:hypothetical protein H257_08905 [Aphanomyces astaci]XP_009833283.1 hypothetical protein H257_08906 [Aphanomyces astaci]ETV77495.1 hypothetical protein H257_08905 [Aphanomyces astaci]ETV77496.1 hypothetical protein H257_08906 [Aphanomyces astaci]|eukprot:XP_009833282.1 hypothetical protein H257_08905 [Aphanomyces astaci]